MKKFSAVSFLLALASLFVFGCSGGHPEGKPIPRFNFDHIEAFPVDVSAVEAINHYSQAKPANDASSMFVMAPDETLQRYLQSRYQARGQRGRLVFEIQEASVYQFNQEAASAPARWLDVGGYEEYNLTLKVKVRALDIPGYTEKSRVITAQRRLKLSEHASLAERESRQFEALEKAMHDVDNAVQRAIREDFGI